MKHIKELGSFKKSVSQHHSLERWVVYEVLGYVETWSRWVSSVQFSSKGICVAKEFIHLILQWHSSPITLDLTLPGLLRNLSFGFNGHWIRAAETKDTEPLG